MAFKPLGYRTCLTICGGGVSRQSGSPANHIFSIEKQDIRPMFRPAIKKIATHRYLGRLIVTFRQTKILIQLQPGGRGGDIRERKKKYFLVVEVYLQ